jgi:hypothetical protein
MRLAALLIAGIFLLLTACSDPAPGGASSDRSNDDTVANKTVFYKRFEGTIAGQLIVLHWHQYDNYAYGAYHYRKQGKKIELFNWEDTVKNGTDFYLTERSVTLIPAGSDPHWVISAKGDRISGKWISGDNTKTYEIELKESYSPGSYPLSLIYISDSAILLPDKPEPQARTTSLVVTPSSSMPADRKEFLSSVINQTFGCDAAITQLSDCIARSNKLYFDSYRKETLEMDTSGISSPDFSSPSFSYSSDRNIRVNYNDNDFLILEDFVSDYSGGAHGNYGSSFLRLDLKSHVTLGLYDIINPEDTSKLLPLIQKHAAITLNLKSNESLSEYLFEDSVPLTPNCYFSETGITFVYNPYEIAAYAAGQINIFVPFSAIKDFLTPSFRSRMKL